MPAPIKQDALSVIGAMLQLSLQQLRCCGRDADVHPAAFMPGPTPEMI